MSKDEPSIIKQTIKEKILMNKQSLHLIEFPKKIMRNLVNFEKSNSAKKRNFAKKFSEPLSDLKHTTYVSPNLDISFRKDLNSNKIIKAEINIYEVIDKKEENKPKDNYQSNNIDNISVIENNNHEADNNEENMSKKKKDWKSWSSTEKEVFYEANYCSLQKLFKNMNDVRILY